MNDYVSMIVISLVKIIEYTVIIVLIIDYLTHIKKRVTKKLDPKRLLFLKWYAERIAETVAVRRRCAQFRTGIDSLLRPFEGLRC
jgi:hypothetical protein